MGKLVLAETVVQRTAVEGKPISRAVETTWGGEKGGTKGKLQGKIGCDMHGTAPVYQFLMCNTMAHHAFSAPIPAH